MGREKAQTGEFLETLTQPALYYQLHSGKGQRNNELENVQAVVLTHTHTYIMKWQQLCDIQTEITMTTSTEV